MEDKAMNCPNCNTQNDPDNQFCVNCGQLLGESTATKGQPQIEPAPIPARPPGIARSVPELLQILTIRMLVILLGLWLLKVVLNWLPFIKELRIPNSPLSVATIINTIVFLIIIVWLISYSRMLWVLWPQALPRYQEAGSFLVMLIYIVILVVFYNAARPLVVTFAPDTEALTVLQVALFIIALLMLIYAIVVVYQRLPFWLPAIRQSAAFRPPSGNEVACLHCGTLNNAGAAFCSSCGQPLAKGKA
jgi:membrane protease subunit (stomatin/prohibitin family)